MKLQETAHQAWLKHRKAIEAIAKPTGRGGRILLGGGTIRGARWGHRKSIDIDVLLPDRNELSDAHPGQFNDLEIATGGKIKGKWHDRIKVNVGETTLDVCAMQPELPGLERPTDIEQSTETVLASAQILRGKLNRSHRHLARDAFDLITAARVDPRALQHAINALDETETRVVTRNLNDGNDTMARDAPEALSISKGFETDLDRLGYNAAATTHENRYTRVQILLEPGTVVIKRQTSKGNQPPESYESDGIAEALIESGIGAYLNANHGTHETIMAQGIAELIANGRRGAILDTARANPVEKIRNAAERMLAREEQALLEAPPTGKPAQVPSRPRSEPGAWKTKLKEELRIEDEPDDPPEPPSPAAGTAEAAKQREQQRNKPQR